MKKRTFSPFIMKLFDRICLEQYFTVICWGEQQDLAGRILWETNSNIESKDPLIIVNAKKALTVFIFYHIKVKQADAWKIQKKVKVTFCQDFQQVAQNASYECRVLEMLSWTSFCCMPWGVYQIRLLICIIALLHLFSPLFCYSLFKFHLILMSCIRTIFHFLDEHCAAF